MEVSEFIRLQKCQMNELAERAVKQWQAKLRDSKTSKFELGELVITANATAKLTALQTLILLRRHQTGDWGVVCSDDWLANEDALQAGDRIVSKYDVADFDTADLSVLVITEWNRESTTVLLPEDY